LRLLHMQQDKQLQSLSSEHQQLQHEHQVGCCLLVKFARQSVRSGLLLH
jgi:hypothetical protein